MISKRFTDTVKGGLSRAKNAFSYASSNFPKVVSKAIETSRNIANRANQVKQIADRAQSVVNQNQDLIKNEKVKSGISKGFNVINRGVQEINNANDVVSRVGNSIMSA